MHWSNSWAGFLVVVVILYWSIRFLRHGGLRGILFGSQISGTVGEIELGWRSGFKQTLRLYRLADTSIGFELSTRGIGGSIAAITLSNADAIKLIALLQSATSETNS